MLICSACKKDPSPPLSPEAERNSFQIDPSFRIELVAAEPLVQDPVSISFDEDGRLWVVEMQGFMRDIDGTGENDPIGKIAVLEDEDGNGQMDKRTVFLDSLVLPRALAVVAGGALVAERIPLWFAQGHQWGFRADTKVLIDSTYGGHGMPEHSPNGLWRGMDNWFYNAKSDKRYRKIGTDWVQSETEFRGQWGICHDNVGRLFYNYNWSQLHADLVPPNYLSRNPHHKPTSGIDHGLSNDRKVYPIRTNTAINRGYIAGTLDKDRKLKEFASACSPLIYRGHTFPHDFQGNAFVCDPSANLIKRNVLSEDSLLLFAKDAYDKKEFLASTDERFRPVFLAAGPDGGLYIADMYKGIIQHGPYMTPYLRSETLKRKLENPIHMGRIWRIVPRESTYSNPEPLSQKTSQELVPYLAHPNGWHRDMAQHLLVEKQDEAIVPSLEKMVLTDTEALGRLHALWTLEGLGADKPGVLLRASEDSHPYVRSTAIRLLESHAGNSPQLLEALAFNLQELWQVEDFPVILQSALSAGVLPLDKSLPILTGVAANYVESPVLRDAVLSSLAHKEYALLTTLLDLPEWDAYSQAKGIFLESLATAIANKGDAFELGQLIGRVSTNPEEWDWRAKAFIGGIALHQPREGESKVTLASRPPLFEVQEDWEKETVARIGKVANLFSWPGKQEDAKYLKASKPLTEDEFALFVDGRQKYLATCAGCHGMEGEGMSRSAPPLVGSEWVVEDEKRLILILLHGMEGPIEVNGKHFDVPDILPVMPALPILFDDDIAAILTYIRNDWGNQASAVKPRLVSKLRHRSQGKTKPWRAEELIKVDFSYADE